MPEGPLVDAKAWARSLKGKKALSRVGGAAAIGSAVATREARTAL
jgi:hypothetical protein